MQTFYVQAHHAKTYLMEPWIFIRLKPVVLGICFSSKHMTYNCKWTGIIKLRCENLFPLIQCTTYVQYIFPFEELTIPFINQKSLSTKNFRFTLYNSTQHWV